MNHLAVLCRRTLAEIEYPRPGYTLRWDTEDGLCIVIETLDPDSGEPIEQTHGFGYPEIPHKDWIAMTVETFDRAEFADWVFTRIMVQQLHEATEFFRWRGNRRFDPHGRGMEDVADLWALAGRI